MEDNAVARNVVLVAQVGASSLLRVLPRPRGFLTRGRSVKCMPLTCRGSGVRLGGPQIYVWCVCSDDGAENGTRVVGNVPLKTAGKERLEMKLCGSSPVSWLAKLVVPVNGGAVTPGAVGIWPFRVEGRELDPCLSCDVGTRCAVRSTMGRIGGGEDECEASQLI